MNRRALLFGLAGVLALAFLAPRTKPPPVRTTGAWHGTYRITSPQSGCDELTDADPKQVFSGEYYGIRGALIAMSGVHATPCATAEACREFVAHEGAQTYTRFLTPGVDKDLLMELQGDELLRVAHYASLNGGLSDIRMSLDTDGDVQLASPATGCRVRSERMTIRRDGDALALEYTLSEGEHADEATCEAAQATRAELHCTVRHVARLEPLSPGAYHQTDLVLDQPTPVAGTAAIAVLRTPSAEGSGLRRFRVVLTWPDGTVDDQQGPMPVIFESHGYRFSLEGWKNQATLEVEPLAP